MAEGIIEKTGEKREESSRKQRNRVIYRKLKAEWGWNLQEPSHFCRRILHRASHQGSGWDEKTIVDYHKEYGKKNKFVSLGHWSGHDHQVSSKETWESHSWPCGLGHRIKDLKPSTYPPSPRREWRVSDSTIKLIVDDIFIIGREAIPRKSPHCWGGLCSVQGINSQSVLNDDLLFIPTLSTQKTQRTCCMSQSSANYKVLYKI